MFTVIVTILVTLAIAGLLIRYLPAGWRTRLIMWGTAVLAAVSGILNQIEAIDWTRLIDMPKVAYGLTIAIPIIAGWLREITSRPGALAKD